MTIQDIEANLPPTPWLDALNTRYFIIGGDYAPVENDAAYGPAWMVSETLKAASPDEEILLSGSADLRTQAVIGPDFTVPTGIPGVSPVIQESITLTSYTPNELTYTYNVAEDALAVFSEVYYPGWKAWIDGDRSKGVEVLRADWTLRAAVLPAGEHTLTMRFEPASYKMGEHVSRASSILLVLLLLGSAARMLLPFVQEKGRKLGRNTKNRSSVQENGSKLG